MDSGELIELFYNRTYEKFVNKQILDDKNFVVPRQQLINYVHELVNIPFINFIDYIKHNDNDRKLEPSDITQFSSFPSCELEMCNALLWANNPGCKYADIGRFFPNKLTSRSESAYWRYGEIHIKASAQLGLTFEYYKFWYLSCLGYIYPELEKNLRMQLLARTIIRNRLYQQLLIDLLDHDLNPDLYINIFPNYNFNRCKRSVCYFLNICLDICRKEGIKTHKLIKRYETHQKFIQDYNPLEINERIEKYLMEISCQDYLSIEEEVELAANVRRGDINARNRLVTTHMRYVIEPAKQYLHKGLEFEDLLHEGFLGLIRATEHFDETRGFKFIHYALWWIRRYLSEAIILDSSLIKFPLSVRILHKRVKDFKVKYEHQYGFLPPVTEIEIDNEDNNEFISYLDKLPNNLKDTCISYEDLDVFEDNHNDILDYEDNEYYKYYVRGLLDRLSEKEKYILTRVYGIGVKEETLETIGYSRGLTRERVRQIKETSIKKLRDMMCSESSEIQFVEKQRVQYNDSPEHNISSNNTVETQTFKDVKKVLSQDNINFVQNAQVQSGEAKNNDSVIIPSETPRKDTTVYTSKYTVVNYGGKCIIYDNRKKQVYSSTGYIKEFDNTFYRISFTLSFFSIRLIEKYSAGCFCNGDKLLWANQTSSLFKKLKYKDHLEQIEDIDFNGRKVKVCGCWFDKHGNAISEITEQKAANFENKAIIKESDNVNNYNKQNDERNNQVTSNAQGEFLKQTTFTYNTHHFKWKVGDKVSLQLLFSGSVKIDRSPYYVFRRKILFIFINNETKENIQYFDGNQYSIETDSYKFEMNMNQRYGKKNPRILIFIHNDDGSIRFFDEADIQCVGSGFIQFKSII